MVRSIPRALAAALFGALAGPAFLVLAYGLSPEIRFAVERLPPVSAGFYDTERIGKYTFVWTSRRADVNLDGVDRRVPWSCSVRVRGARPASQPQPDVDLAVDGVTAVTRRATNDFQEIIVAVPALPVKTGVRLTLSASSTFVPGGADLRALGVQVDQIVCRPAGASAVLPPRRTTGAAAAAGAIFGAAFGLAGITAGSAIGAAVLLCAAQAVPLASGVAPYSSYGNVVVRLAFWIALLTVVFLKLLEVGRPQHLRNTARFAVLFPAGVLYLTLLGLAHPSKALVDAVFHAHRFDAVLAGRYYFTQLSTSATPFPYAIGLYVFAAPWSFLTGDHVMLLRVVVCAAAAVAGGLVYLMVVSTGGDRLTGALAVALANVVPVSYAVVGNANLTYAFGQSVALAAVAVVTIWPPDRRHVGPFIALVLLAAFGFTSHIAALVLLAATLVALWFFYRFAGGPALRPVARWLVLGAIVALALSVVFYWGHFAGVYEQQLTRARAAVTSSSAAGRTVTPAEAPDAEAPALGHRRIPLPQRSLDAVAQTLGNIGWPILALALVGAWRFWTGRNRDRLALAVAAWAAVGVGFVVFSVLTAVDMKYQQDAWEFIGRVEHTTCPAAVILAAVGATWAWRAGMVWRLATCALLLAAVVVGVRAWTVWL